MSGERREPTFSAKSSTSDEVQKTAAAPAPSQKRRPPPVSGTAKPTVVTTKSSPAALLVAIVAVAFSAFVYWQLQQTMQAMKNSEVRIIELEGMLALSGDESTQSLTVLQSNLRNTQKELKMASTEVRKLWDTRNVNRKAILDNTAIIKATTVEAKNANKLAKSHVGTIKQLSSDNALLTEQLTLSSGLLDEQQKSVRELQDVSSRLDFQMAKLSSDLTSRVKNNEEAITAIDAYRRSTNRQLLELQKKLSQQVPASPQ